MAENTESNRRQPTLRRVRLGDAAQIHQLVVDSGVLDPNSCYLYLLLCHDFADTCLVAESDDRVVAFVTAYRPPSRPDAIFVWQVGVSPSMQRRGLARQLLMELLRQPATADAQYLEATVAPSNTASRRLFQSVADAFGVEAREIPCFSESDFGGGSHEGEPLLRIGPLPPQAQRGPKPAAGSADSAAVTP